MSRCAVVVGAGGAVGESAAAHLIAAGWRVTATMRRMQPIVAARLEAMGATVTKLDLTAPFSADIFRGADAAVFTPILTLAARAAPVLRSADVPRVIAFSSNNVAIDARSSTYRALAAAEATMHAAAASTIVLRPTLIYGDPRLRTLARVIAFARRSPILPVPGSGRALQQPVFYDDLGKIAAMLAHDGAEPSATYALGGPDIVSMKALFEAAAEAGDARPQLMPMPQWAMAVGKQIMGERFPFDDAQIARVEHDRLAVAQTPLPEAFAPRTDLRTGLARLVAAMDAR